MRARATATKAGQKPAARLFANAAALAGHFGVAIFSNEATTIEPAHAEKKTRRVLLAPYGDWPNQRGMQRFKQEDARNIVNEFQSLAARALNPASWLGIPWYEGHPDHPDFRGKPGHTRPVAVGRIKALEAGNDGLWAEVRFNEDGERLITNESYHGHSVNWYMLPDKKDAKAHRPFSLKSVGFTNEPNIPVPAVTTANEAGGRELRFQHMAKLRAAGYGKTQSAANNWSDAAREAAAKARKLSAAAHSASAEATDQAGGTDFSRHRAASEAHTEAMEAHQAASTHGGNNYMLHRRQARIHQHLADLHADDAEEFDKPEYHSKSAANAGTSEGAKKGWASRASGYRSDVITAITNGHGWQAAKNHADKASNEAWSASAEAQGKDDSFQHQQEAASAHRHAAMAHQHVSDAAGHLESLAAKAHNEKADFHFKLMHKIVHSNSGIASAANAWSDAAREAALEARREHKQALPAPHSSDKPFHTSPKTTTKEVLESLAHRANEATHRANKLTEAAKGLDFDHPDAIKSEAAHSRAQKAHLQAGLHAFTLGDKKAYDYHTEMRRKHFLFGTRDQFEGKHVEHHELPQSDSDRKEMIHDAHEHLRSQGMKPSHQDVADEIEMNHGIKVPTDEIAKHLTRPAKMAHLRGKSKK